MTDFQERTISRRRFLQAGATTALGLAVSAREACAEDKANAYGGFTVGVQSYSFRKFNTEQCLKRTHDLGLHWIEFFQKHAPMNSTPAEIKALLRMCSDYDVKPIAFGVQRFTKNHDENKKTFEFGQALGIKVLSADPTPDSFDSLDMLVDEYKIAIGIHPHGPTGGGKLHHWYSAEIILAAVKDHHPLIGTCIDTGHLIRSAQLGKHLDPAQQIRVMGARNFGLHLKDHDNRADTDVVFGKGVLDVLGVLKALKEVQFKGYISLEYEAHEDEPSPDMKACLEVLRDAARTLG